MKIENGIVTSFGTQAEIEELRKKGKKLGCSYHSSAQSKGKEIKGYRLTINLTLMQYLHLTCALMRDIAGCNLEAGKGGFTKKGKRQISNLLEQFGIIGFPV